MTRVHSLPAFLIGSMMAVYWARVLRLAWKEKRRTGRAANLLPPEPLGRALRLIWFPVIFLWIGLPLAEGGFLRTGYPRPAILRPLLPVCWWSWTALGVATGAFLATLVCWKRMGKSWRMGIDPDDKTQLVSSGAYAYMRHPIYALSTLLMLCTMVIVPTPLMLIVGVLHLLLLQWEARREERYLVALHGDAYRDYAKRVGRFLPRMRTRVN